MERSRSTGDIKRMVQQDHPKVHTPSQKAVKRRRRSSETDRMRSHGGKRDRHRPQNKRAKLGGGGASKIVSSKSVANTIMKLRLGGSVSDPLNLEGYTGEYECSTCAPSPTLEDAGQPSPLPAHLQRDPLNLEGKVKDFPAKTKRGGDRHCGERRHGGRQWKKTRRRTISHSEGAEGGGEEEGGKGKGKEKERGLPTQMPVFNPKGSQYCYGNYDKYYGYRNSGVFEDDPRLSLLRKEWFEGKDCLDIGSNTGQVTIRVARDMNPRRIVGMDIDSKLVGMAWKNLHRYYVPAVTPDGRPFPLSFALTRGPMIFLPVGGGGEQRGFPHNIQFEQGNYVPESDAAVESQQAEFDVILALSLTKWVHLNWGDAGLKRFFRKLFRHLRPGGRLLLEPQPFSSYTKKKKLTPTIYENYYSLEFLPDQFHSYLMSPEVGFSSHTLLGVPHNKYKGFRRPLHMYVKGDGDSSEQSETSQSKCEGMELGHSEQTRTERELNVSGMECGPEHSEHEQRHSVETDLRNLPERSTAESSQTDQQRCDSPLQQVQ